MQHSEKGLLGGRVAEWVKPLGFCSMVALIGVGSIPTLARFVMAVFSDSLQCMAPNCQEKIRKNPRSGKGSNKLIKILNYATMRFRSKSAILTFFALLIASYYLIMTKGWYIYNMNAYKLCYQSVLIN